MHTVVIVRALSNGCSKDTGYESGEGVCELHGMGCVLENSVGVSERDES